LTPAEPGACHVAVRHPLPILRPAAPAGIDRKRIAAGAKTMQLTLLKAKIHRATVTHAELHYEGSCAIDGRLLEISGIREYGRIEIYNVNNGERFATYAIRGEEGSGVISVNGAAAHKAQPGDLVIICAYGHCEEAEAARFKPTLVYVDRDNRMTHTNRSLPQQAA
jgi:aspartate 1-decarboxylase